MQINLTIIKMKRIVLLSLIILISISAYSQDPQVSDLLDKGINLIMKKEYKSAIAVFDEAQKISPDEPEIYAHRGQARHLLNLYKDAIEDYNVALRLQPDYAEVYHLRGLAKGKLQDNIGACEDWELAYEKGESRALELIVEFCQTEKGTKNKKSKQ